jgi:hypothetical protein
MRRQLIFLSLLVALDAGSATPRGIPVNPGQAFGGKFMMVRAPASAGWEKIKESSSGITFGKLVQETGESFVADVEFFSLPPTETPEQFLALVKAGQERDTDPARFAVESETRTYSAERPYPCARYQSVTRDKERMASGEPLVLEMDGIVCRHPDKPEVGFSVIFSHRGPQRYPALRTEAESFIQSAQVPEK